ncbi:beta-galactosidase [Belliella sp. R4-6]|uniref:Beta-galactosidase n=1 Tax=Belliella alkalica TaxID=1730871 RepID=A0ABS9VF44_9BACT|nr:sugar-binding domain-containing protein [Belliella alkalica]MCH7415076.1 beta-galactosidase [Belliella alkalica]
MFKKKRRKILTKTFALVLGLGFSTQINAQELPKPVIQSTWAEESDGLNHDYYPRPQMERADWVNLNGEWDYAILAKGTSVPSQYQGKIKVPFAVESSLSGVGKNVGKDQELWYSKTIDLDKKLRKGRVLLHFGAVDWESEVFVNGQKVGIHQGGFDSFSYDITDFLKSGSSQELSVRVWDPSDDGPQPRGKQVKKPHSIWYTPVTGIWQTVWLESVPTSYLTEVQLQPDFDQGAFRVSAKVNKSDKDQTLEVIFSANGSEVGRSAFKANENGLITIDNPKVWSPSDPFLYDVTIKLRSGKKVLDQVKSYSALRKISVEKDQNGIERMMLNNEFLFQYGPLDQGWWPDGLYTAPSEAAMLFDIEKTKEMGFNMIRKHVKVEPARWYYHTDRLGLLVWQDMPNGDHGNNWESRPGILGHGTDKVRTKESEGIFKKEWKAIIDGLSHFQSIVVWVPFNEAWGQFKTKEITEWTMEYDPSRLVNSASGGNFEMEGTKITGDIIDLHNYPNAVMPEPEIYGKEQVIVLGEFGGLGLPVEGHTWQEKDNWGYQSFKTRGELQEKYKELMASMIPLIQRGLSAAVYTQTTDVEIEVNGLMTYDRKVIKFDIAALKSLNEKLYDVKVEF